jgi:CheY-like chemotaxis protein
MGGIGGRHRAEALKWLRETKTLDLLITDIHLANAMTGWEVAEAARELHSKIPVIHASGNPNNDNRRVPDSIFLKKPVSARELVLACRKLYPARPPHGIDMDLPANPTHVIDDRRASG